MYSTVWCGFCKKAREYFVANRIPFVEYDVDKDIQAMRRYKKLVQTECRSFSSKSGE